LQPLSGLDPNQPPLSLLDFPPVADLCNLILGGLNELRLMAPVALGPEVTSRIQVFTTSKKLGILFSQQLLRRLPKVLLLVWGIEPMYIHSVLRRLYA
jgi:hypothetical protein